MMNRIGLVLAPLVLVLSGCATGPIESQSDSKCIGSLEGAVSLFSIGPEGGLPNCWKPMVVFRTKKQTEYQLVREDDTTILRAHAANATSGLMQKIQINPHDSPWINWRWKITSIVQPPDLIEDGTEDSPVRIILGFDGDKDKLPFRDQILFETARVVTGHDFPYATLMYSWDKALAPGTVIPSRRSSRIKTLVVQNGLSKIGDWIAFERNILEDYQRAFGESPGKLIGLGVLTDAENPGESVEAWYGDIQIKSRQEQLSN